MARWFPLESTDASVFETAPQVFRHRLRYDAPPEAVWMSLASDRSLADWGPAVREVNWTSPRPFGVGTTREVVAPLGLARMREHFFRWDEGSGYSFYVYETNAPLFRKFAEDYALAPDGAGTLFTWTVAIQPKPTVAALFRVLAPVVRAGFGRMASDGQRYFADR